MEGGRVFVARSIDQVLFGYDLATGRELWRRSLPPGSHNAHISGVRDGQVYASRSYSGSPEYYFALDAVDGSTLWQSQALIDENAFESLGFSPEGDPIVGGMTSIIRMDRATGHTVWSVSRSCVGWGACSVAVSGNRFFAANFVSSGIGVDAYDVATGGKLYSSGPLSSGGSQIQIFTGPGGRVYAPFVWNQAGDALIALNDTGVALTEAWRTPVPYLVFPAFAVWTDGSVFSFSTAHEIVRLNPATGAVIVRSTPLPFSSGFIPRLATDNSRLLMTLDDGTSTSATYAFGIDLSLLWKDALPHPFAGGPAIGRDGTLLVCGDSGNLKAYRNSPSSDSPLRVDPRASATSNGNGVLEPGETVAVDPHGGTCSRSL